MRFKYDNKKSEQLRNNPKRGIGFDNAQELFEHYYYEDLRCDDPDPIRRYRLGTGEIIHSDL